MMVEVGERRCFVNVLDESKCRSHPEVVYKSGYTTGDNIQKVRMMKELKPDVKITLHHLHVVLMINLYPPKTKTSRSNVDFRA